MTKVRKPAKDKGKKAPAPKGKMESEQKDAGDKENKSTVGEELVDLVKSEAEDCDSD